MHEKDRRPEGEHPWLRRIGWGSSGLVLAIAAVMVMSPLSSAASPSSVLVPLKSFGVTLSTDTSQGACGVAKLVKAPTFSLKTHLFHGSVSANAPSCKPGQSENEAQSTEELTLETTKLKFPTSGNMVLNATWTFTVNETWSMIPYTHCKVNYANPSSECMTWTEDTIYSQPILFDESNSTWGQYGVGLTFATPIDIYTSSFAYVQNSSCAGCNYSYGATGAGSFSGTLNGTNSFNLSGLSKINKADHFELEILFEISCTAYAFSVDAKTTGAASASSSINASTAGNRADLLGVTIT
jgi:hypothetical protein